MRFRVVLELSTVMVNNRDKVLGITRVKYGYGIQ